MLVHCVHRNPAVAPTFTSEMIITDTVVHEIDCVRWLLDQEIVRATRVRRAVVGRVARRACAIPSSSCSRPRAAWSSTSRRSSTARYGYDIRCELVGESGTLALAPTATVVARRGGEEAGSVPARLPGALRDGLRARAAGVVGGDRRGRGRVGGASAWDGYAATVACEAAVASLHRGEAVDIRLEPKPALYAGGAHAGALSHPSTLRLTRAGCS